MRLFKEAADIKKRIWGLSFLAALLIISVSFLTIRLYSRKYIYYGTCTLSGRTIENAKAEIRIYPLRLKTSHNFSARLCLWDPDNNCLKDYEVEEGRGTYYSIPGEWYITADVYSEVYNAYIIMNVCLSEDYKTIGIETPEMTFDGNTSGQKTENDLILCESNVYTVGQTENISGYRYSGENKKIYCLDDGTQLLTEWIVPCAMEEYEDEIDPALAGQIAIFATERQYDLEEALEGAYRDYQQKGEDFECWSYEQEVKILSVSEDEVVCQILLRHPKESSDNYAEDITEHIFRLSGL